MPPQTPILTPVPEDYSFIYFPHPGDSMKPQRVWKSNGLLHNKRYCYVAPDAPQAQAGYGHPVEWERLQNFTPELWARCEAFIKFRQLAHDLAADAYADLMKGKPIQTELPLFNPLELALDALRQIANDSDLSGGEAIELAAKTLKTIGVIE